MGVAKISWEVVDATVLHRCIEYWPNESQLLPQVKLRTHVLPRAGHWLHVDNAQGLLELIASSLPGLQKH